VFDFLRKVLGAGPEDEAAQGLPRPNRGSILSSGPKKIETRRSNGLRHFFDSIPKSRGIELLDLGGANEANVNFLAEIGGKIHFVDLLGSYDRFQPQPGDDKTPLDIAREFVDEHLNFARNQFDAILGWDALEFLDVDVLHLTAPRLNEILRPGGALLTLFHTQGRGATVPVYRYRIEGLDTLSLEPRNTRVLPNTFNNRSLERLFAEYSSVKFFLTRDNLREVIVSR
jgi:hypothetical protein